MQTNEARYLSIGPRMRRITVFWKAERDFLALFEVNKFCLSFSLHLIWFGISGYFYWRP